MCLALTSMPAWLNPHEVLNANEAIDALRASLPDRNPFSDGLFTDVIARGPVAGLDLAATLREHRAEISGHPLAVLPANAGRQAAARAFLRRIAKRAWASETNVPFWLRRAASSPLLLAADSHGLRLRASMGGGRVLHFRALTFPGTDQTPLVVDGSEIEGGDVHIWVHTSYDAVLDGEALVARRRRTDEDYDDD